MRDNIIVQRPTVTANTSQYAAGDTVHSSALSFDVAGSGPGCYLMPPVVVSDTAITGTTFLLTIFESAPSTTFTVNGAQTIAAADDQLILGCFKLDQEALPGGCSVHYSTQTPMAVRGTTDGRLWAALSILAGTPTLSATTDISLVITSVRQV